MCLVRGFGKGIWGRARIWGMEFYNSFVSLDERIRCKLMGEIKMGFAGVTNSGFKSNQNKRNLIDSLNMGFSFERTKSRLPSSMINPSILSVVILTILSLFIPYSSLKIHGKPQLYKFLPHSYLG